MANSTLAIINSRNRLPESLSSSNFSYNIGSTIEIQELALKSVSLPNTAYNININNKNFNFIYNGNQYSFALPLGQYNISTINAAIISGVGSAVGNPTALSIITDELTQKQKYTFALPTQIYISTLATLIGFNLQLDTLYPSTPATLINAPTLPNLQGSMNYYIASRTLAQGTNALLYNAVRNLAILAVIPNSVPFGSVIQYVPNDILLDLKSYAGKQNIQQIDIIVLDTDFNIVDLNGAEIELTFKCYLKPRVEGFSSK
jgi:hypothetical protein